RSATRFPRNGPYYSAQNENNSTPSGTEATRSRVVDKPEEHACRWRIGRYLRRIEFKSGSSLRRASVRCRVSHVRWLSALTLGYLTAAFVGGRMDNVISMTDFVTDMPAFM